MIVAEVPEEHVYKAIKEICGRQLNPLLALVDVNHFSVHFQNNVTMFNLLFSYLVFIRENCS